MSSEIEVLILEKLEKLSFDMASVKEDISDIKSVQSFMCARLIEIERKLDNVYRHNNFDTIINKYYNLKTA